MEIQISFDILYLFCLELTFKFQVRSLIDRTIVIGNNVNQISWIHSFIHGFISDSFKFGINIQISSVIINRSYYCNRKSCK